MPTHTFVFLAAVSVLAAAHETKETVSRIFAPVESFVSPTFGPQ